jgi:hypothetical protein
MVMIVSRLYQKFFEFVLRRSFGYKSKTIPRIEAFHDKRDTYNCSIDYYIPNKSHAFIIGLWSHMKVRQPLGDNMYDVGVNIIPRPTNMVPA